MRLNLARWLPFVLLSLGAIDAFCSSLGAQESTEKETSFMRVYYGRAIALCANEHVDHPNKDDEGKVAVAPKIVAGLIAWIIGKAEWAVCEAPPIRFIPYAELVKKFTGGKPTDFRVEALYSDQDHSIYLLDGWRADDLRDRSILLHELVHHLQYLNHVKATCKSEYEIQAVKLQVAWLREQGVEDPLNLIGINSFFILMLGQCE